MATYVNDLRLKEIGTGESSGTWGTETNTNLELIAEAFSFGTEAITTNADTHTTTIADGSTDPGRSIFLKYTGTLDSACTITIGPNTVSKLWFIENGTSGSQNIIISQGSGANITIPPGDVKAIYSDGAGSGAAMVDAFASLSVVDLKVQDDLTVTDDMTVGGTLGVTGILTCTDDIIIGDGKTIGSASDVDAMTIASNGQVTFTQTLIGTALDISGDIDVDGTTNLDVVDIDGAVDMASTLGVTGVLTANAGVVVDNITIDGTEIDLSSGDLTLDVAGNIILDADGAEVAFKDGGTHIGSIINNSSDFVFRSIVQDKDVLIRGNDGGSAITACTFDMSEAGKATFNSDIVFGGTGPITSATNALKAANTGDNGFLIRSAVSSAANPSYSSVDDTNTGMFLPGSDVIGLTTGGSERLRVASDGDVLIGGTTDRSRRLVVEGTGDLMALYSTNAGAGGAQLDLIHDSASPADGDNVGIINFSDDAKQYASFKGIAESTGASGAIHLGVRRDASNYNATAVIIKSTGNVELGLGGPLQATADGRAVNQTVGTSFVTVLDFSTIGGSNAGTGFYLVTVVREGASVGTSITLQVGVSSSGLVIIYDTIQSNGLSAQASNAQIQVKQPSGGDVEVHATAIPMSITGFDT
jgi:hypothetical protein